MLLDQLPSPNFKGLLPLFYNRHIESPTVLLDGDHLLFAEKNGIPDQADIDAGFTAAFEASLRRYLQGKGHPNHRRIQDLVGKDAIQRAAGDIGLRARMLMRTAHETDYVPLKDDWGITVRS